MKILIAYSTKYGTTKKCVDYLKDKLTGDVDVIFIDKDKKTDLTKYDCFIVGGSIYMGLLRSATRKFCEKYLEQLKTKKLGLFVCHMDKDTPADELIEKHYPQLVEHAVAKSGFGGATKISEMNRFHKFIFLKVAKTTEDEDFINYSEIDKFADIINS